MQLPKYLKDRIIYGDENRGIEVTENAMYIYENGKKHLLATSDIGLVARSCRCGADHTAHGAYHLDEIEASVCPKCGGVVIKAKEKNIWQRLK